MISLSEVSEALNLAYQQLDEALADSAQAELDLLDAEYEVHEAKVTLEMSKDNIIITHWDDPQSLGANAGMRETKMRLLLGKDMTALREAESHKSKAERNFKQVANICKRAELGVALAERKLRLIEISMLAPAPA